jgi:hypothetical protein
MAITILLAQLGGASRQEGGSADAFLPGHLGWQYFYRAMLLLLMTATVSGVRSALAAQTCATTIIQRP